MSPLSSPQELIARRDFPSANELRADVSVAGVEFKSLPDQCRRFEDELSDWWGKKYSNCLVGHQGRTWFVRTTSAPDKMRNLLAWNLGQQIANVAEVKGLERREFTALRNSGVDLSPGASWRNTCLVRFAPEYNVDEMPKTNLNSAMASELVFSMWIRRRDAHSCNRSFTAGVPVFYDHEVAFLGERNLRKIGNFFRTGPDPGYAGLWRLERVPAHDYSTISLRQKERERFSGDQAGRHVYLPIHDKTRFAAELDNARDQIKALPAAVITSSVRKAGFGFPLRGMIVRFLITNQNRIDSEIVRLKSVLGVS